MFFPKLLDGGDGQSRNIFFLLIGQVRHAIQYVQPGIHFADELQHFFRQFAIAGKAEVYERVIQRTLEAQAPCAIEVPYRTIGFSGETGMNSSFASSGIPISSHFTPLYKGR